MRMMLSKSAPDNGIPPAVSPPTREEHGEGARRQTQPAAEPAWKPLQAAFRRLAETLGSTDPTQWLGSALEKSFPLPMGDPLYGANALGPGALPVEVSFSETSPNHLRLDFELFGPAVTPLQRRRQTFTLARSLAAQQFGEAAGRWFDRHQPSVEPTPAASSSETAAFGAFFGSSFGPRGPEAFKFYGELGGRLPKTLPRILKQRTTNLLKTLPNTTPLLWRLSQTTQGPNQRLYFTNPKEQRLLELEPLIQQLATSQQFPHLMASLLPLVNHHFTLPPGTLVYSLGDTSRDADLKIEILLSRLPRRQTEQAIVNLFASRPNTHSAFERWRHALPGQSLNWSAAGARASAKNPCRINVYALPWLCDG